MFLFPFIFSFNKKTKRKKNNEGDAVTYLTPFESTFLQPNKLDFNLMNDYKFRFLICLLLTIPILVLSPTTQKLTNLNLRFSGDTYLLLALTTFVVVYGGWPFFKAAFTELKTLYPSTMTLLSLAIIIFYTYAVLTIFNFFIKDVFWILACVIVILSLFHWLQALLALRIANQINELTNYLPAQTNKVGVDGQLASVSCEALEVNDVISINQDETIPVDGIILKGVSLIDEFHVLGTMKPVEKQVHDEVFAGSINKGSTLFIKVMTTVDNSYLVKASEKIISLHEQDEISQSDAQKKARLLVIFILFVTLATLITWLILNKDLAFAIERALAVLLIASPFALVLTSTFIITNTALQAFKNGILIHQRKAFEEILFLHSMTFNETAMFSNTEYSITNIETYNDYEEDEAIFDLASLLIKVDTPFSKGVLKYAYGIELELDEVTNERHIPDVGSEGYLDGDKVSFYYAPYAIQQQLPFNVHFFKTWIRDGKTVIFLLANDILVSMIAFKKPLHYDAQEPVHFLKEMDFDVNLLTANSEEAAYKIAKKLNINKVFSNLSLENKVKTIQTLQHEEHLEIGVVGNALTDAPLLRAANVSFAVNTGQQLTTAADVQIVKNEPIDVVETVKYATANYHKTKQLFWTVLLYSIVAILLATGVLSKWGLPIPPLIAVVLMTISTLLILLWSAASRSSLKAS